MDKKKLKSKMILFGDTGATLAGALDISETRFSAKINGRNGAEFTKAEMGIIKNRYSLSDSEFMEIFYPG